MLSESSLDNQLANGASRFFLSGPGNEPGTEEKRRKTGAALETVWN